MPSYIDMVSIFGSQLDAKELRFSGFREQTILSNPAQGLVIPGLDRSGKHFQLCYHLKTVDCTSPSTTSRQEKAWSIRPATFYHQFDVVYGTTLWIVTKGEVEDIKKEVQDVTGINGRPTDRAFGTPKECFVSSLSIHLLYCNWSTRAWRGYMEWLEYRVDIAVSKAFEILPSDTVEANVYNQTDLVVLGPRTFDGGNQVRREYTPKDLQIAQFLEDKVNETMMVIESNLEVLTKLSKYYEGLVNNDEFPLRQTCANDIRAFATQVSDMIYDLKVQVRRAKLLVRTTSDRKTLVCSFAVMYWQVKPTKSSRSCSIFKARQPIRWKT
jgi:hypothetical protein